MKEQESTCSRAGVAVEGIKIQRREMQEYNKEGGSQRNLVNLRGIRGI
jgi:hypothetical protein